MVNWVSALTTVPAAAIVMLFALGAVVSTDACTDDSCPGLGREGSIDFGVAFYGALAVALVVILSRSSPRSAGAGSRFRWRGMLLVADVVIMAAMVAR